MNQSDSERIRSVIERVGFIITDQESEADLIGVIACSVRQKAIDKVYSKEILDSLRDSPWGTTQREQKKGLEFDKSQYEEIDKYCKAKNIIWFASAW